MMRATDVTKIVFAISGLGALAALAVACSSSSAGAAARVAVCGTDPAGTTCTCTWEAPAGGATANSCEQKDPRGACCQDPDWKTTDNSTCVCSPPADINCFYSGAKSVCECLVSAAPPSPDFVAITECDAPFPGHCCQDLVGDAGIAPVCECSVKACTKSQNDVANCGASMSNASCGNSATQVAECK